MRTLVVVRHGETVGNSSIRYFGRSDLELSELGRQQMHAARRWLRSHFGEVRLAPVIASPLRRALEGAAIIAGPDCSITQIEEFVEVDFGRFEGLTAAEIATRYPAEFERWNRDRLDPSFSYPGGENRRDFTDRVTLGIERLVSVFGQTSQPQPVSHPQSTSHLQRAASTAPAPPATVDSPIAATGDFQYSAGDVALVVAHRGVNRIICKRLAGVEPQIELGSIQILERASTGNDWRTASTDIVEHLAGLT
jgi:broad specificity phosphatase PhoE